MKTFPSRYQAVRHVSPAAAAHGLSLELAGRVSALYGLSERSEHVFGSPLGPFRRHGRSYSLPRFVYFGPHTHNESLRLAFLSGFDHADLRATVGLLQFIERLVLAPDLGQGLNLSFFPLVDVLGVHGAAATRRLMNEHWLHSAAPEIQLLQKDARARGYHGFVRVESTGTDEVVTAELRGLESFAGDVAGVELITSEDFEPLPVRWEATAVWERSAEGPLSVADDLPLHPFDLVIRLPARWDAELHEHAITSILKRFIIRYRAVHAHGEGI